MSFAFAVLATSLIALDSCFTLNFHMATMESARDFELLHDVPLCIHQLTGPRGARKHHETSLFASEQRARNAPCPCLVMGVELRAAWKQKLWELDPPDVRALVQGQDGPSVGFSQFSQNVGCFLSRT